MHVALYVGTAVIFGLTIYAGLLAYFWWASRGERHS